MSAVLRARLDALTEAGALDWAPARYARARALLQHIEREQSSVALRLQAHLARELDTLQLALNAGIENGLQGAAQRPGREALRSLPPALRRGVQAMAPPSRRRALEARLQSQERSAFGGAESLPADASAADGLVAARRYRESHAAQVVEQLLVEFRAALPEAPGPLNPETLVIRALARLQAVSPEYVERLLRHAEVLCALQRASKAAAPGTAARPARRRRPVKA